VYSAEVGIDRDFVWRLKLAGFDGNPIYVDLAMASGYRNDKVCQFLPLKDRITVLMNFDSKLQISLERMQKGNIKSDKNKNNNYQELEPKQAQDQNQMQEQEIISGWQEVLVWQVNQRPNVDSLENLGIMFYLQFENDANTNYSCEGEGMKIKMEIKRTRVVPDLLWEIINRSQQQETRTDK
jgi:hypothetical protein